MTRAELEHLDRDTLIARAERAGVTRARILTRPELVDELLIRAPVDPVAKQKARGLFGVARDLLARVVDRGLNLPDAAERIRALGGPPVSRPSAPSALPTVTLAEIYAAQGHRERAIETLEGVLHREADHAAARALLSQLRDVAHAVPAPPFPPEEQDAAPPAAPPSVEVAAPAPAPEPLHMLDDQPLPPRYDVDECVAIPVDPRTLYVYWEACSATLAHLATTTPGGRLTLRLLIVEATWDGPRSSVRDYDVTQPLGDFFARDLLPEAVVRVALGWKSGDAFASIAHAPPLETPPGGPSLLVADGLMRWTPQGTVPVTACDGDAASIERALGIARQGETRSRLRAQGEKGFLGSSERWMLAMGRPGE